VNKCKLYWTETAQRDLEGILEYIALDSIERAMEKYVKIKESTMLLETFPAQQRIVPELNKNNINKYRELMVDFWRIMYKKEQNTVYIMAVIDGRRNIEDILLQRQLR